MTARRRAIGLHGEQAAAAHLRGLGWRLLDRNVRTARGEIDLIALCGPVLVFAEVKSRRCGSTRRPADALESIGPRKRAQVRRLARAWLAEHRSPPGVEEIRFDAIAVEVAADGSAGAIEHLEGAF